MKNLQILVLTVLSLSLIANTTVLGDLVATMQPRSFAEINTNNLDQLNLGQGSIFDIVYQEGACWDSIGEQFLCIGSYHARPLKFIAYKAKTNAWRTISDRPYTYITYHTYDQQTINQKKRIMYLRESHTGDGFYKYDIAANQWSALPANNFAGAYTTCCSGVAYFPEMGGLIYIDGQDRGGTVFSFNETTNQWKQLKSNLGINKYQSFSEYNPVHKVVIFGGGNNSRVLYRVDASENVARMNNPPFDVGTTSGTVSTVDPVTGTYLFFTSSGNFYTYDVTNDSYELQNLSVPVFTSSSSDTKIWGLVAAPVNTYGVVMFLKCNYSGDHQVYVYKHAQKSMIQEPLIQEGNFGLMVSPNPVHSAATIKIYCHEARGTGHELAIYDINGKCIKQISSKTRDSYTWHPTNLPAGIYLLKAKIGNTTYTKRIILIK